MPKILCIDDDPGVLAATEEMLEDVGYEVAAVRNAEAGLAVLGRGGIDLVITDYRLPGKSGLEFLEQIQEEGIDVPVVVVTGYATIDHAVTSIKAGAIDYLTKPVRQGQLEVVVSQALELVRLRRQNEVLRTEVSKLSAERTVVGDSPGFRRVLDAIETAAPTKATVLLHGESGTGKELLARMIHDLSGRGDEAFISVNCAAMPEHLVESMLFGHEKGAFTGATKRTAGAFERANHGTLLLDEISEMRLDLQAKLLRALQEQEFERVGGVSPIRVDARVIATTNRDLQEEVNQNRFRADLFYRLNVLPIRVPPLRERPDDVPALASHFAKKASAEHDRPHVVVAPEAIDKLQRHSWPGNVRELAHAVERAVIFAADGRVTSDTISLGEGSLLPLNGPAAGTGSTRHDGAVVLDTLDVGEAESVLIEAALEKTEGNRTQAAKLLGMSVRTLRNKLNNP
ncbi:MAG: sigma-54-dependent Fis family transcriptional regulator [Gemmatimonadetes bacterium]|nr:sigma-54-dependent Fis family transcriptional regulator [Gemmatimonadota bacterium]